MGIRSLQGDCLEHRPADQRARNKRRLRRCPHGRFSGQPRREQTPWAPSEASFSFPTHPSWMPSSGLGCPWRDWPPLGGGPCGWPTQSLTARGAALCRPSKLRSPCFRATDNRPSRRPGGTESRKATAPLGCRGEVTSGKGHSRKRSHNAEEPQRRESAGARWLPGSAVIGSFDETGNAPSRKQSRPRWCGQNTAVTTLDLASVTGSGSRFLVRAGGTRAVGLAGLKRPGRMGSAGAETSGHFCSAQASTCYHLVCRRRQPSNLLGS